MATGGDGLDPCGNACWGPGIAPALWYAVHSSRQVHSRALAGSAVNRYGWVWGSQRYPAASTEPSAASAWSEAETSRRRRSKRFRRHAPGSNLPSKGAIGSDIVGSTWIRAGGNFANTTPADGLGHELTRPTRIDSLFDSDRRLLVAAVIGVAGLDAVASAPLVVLVSFTQSIAIGVLGTGQSLGVLLGLGIGGERFAFPTLKHSRQYHSGQQAADERQCGDSTEDRASVGYDCWVRLLGTMSVFMVATSPVGVYVSGVA